MLARIPAIPLAHRLLARRALLRLSSDTMHRLDRLIDKLEKNTGATPTFAAAPPRGLEAGTDAQPSHPRPIPAEHQSQQHPPATKPAEGKQPGKEPQDLSPMQLFALAEILIGELGEVAALPGSDKLYTEKVDIGSQRRSVASGLRPHVPIEGMAGKVLLFANLKPRKLAGFLSEGMLLCASVPCPDGGARVELCRPSEASQLGERVFADGFEQDAQERGLPAMKPDHLKRVVELLGTDASGCIVYAGVRLRTRSGYLKASSLPNAKVS